MILNFKLWSQINKEAKEEMRPDLGLREWNNLSPEDKNKIWYYLGRRYFEGEDNARRIFFSILFLNEDYKYKSYGSRTLADPSPQNAFEDFKDIFFNQEQYVVLELLSYFCKRILSKKKNEDLYRGDYKNKTEKEYKKINLEWKFKEFDEFKNRVNDIFEHFGLNVFLTRNGFIFRQDKKITKEIYEPVLNFLSDEKWKEVSRELRDAFQEYQKKTEKGYSSSITHTIAALEAFLQISLYGKIGKGTLGPLIKEAQKRGIIPDDLLSKQVFRNIESILIQERKKTGDAHPKKEYANEKNTRLIINLGMIFLQHCIQV